MRAPAQRTRKGELLNQSYELREVLESDGTFDTYLATDRKHGSRMVRVKLLKPEFALQSNVVQGFLRTPKTLAEFKHPNVVQVLAVESDDTGIPFVVEEHVEGEPLTRTMEQFPDGMPLGVAMNVLAPVFEAVAAAHKRGLVHGGLCGQHVLVVQQSGSSVPKVIRFGVASLGTGARTAPELRSGQSRPDLRSDVWALGALLYETLSGRPPGATEAEHVKLEDYAPHLPTELLSLVERCLAGDPKQRPRAVSEVRDTLQVLRDRLRGDGSKVGPLPHAPKRASAKAVAAGAKTPDTKTPVMNAPAKAPAKPPDAKPPVMKPAAKSQAQADPQSGKPVGRRTAMGRELELPALHDAPTLPDLGTEPEGGVTAARVDEASFDGLFDDEPEVKAKPQVKAKPAPVKTATPPKIGAPAKPKPNEDLALGATLFATSAAAAPSAEEEAPELTLEAEAGRAGADTDTDTEEVVFDISDSEVETVEESPGRRAVAELRTISDLAAAFNPIEGSDRIGQRDEAALARAARRRQEEAGKQAPTKDRKPAAPVPKAALAAVERAQRSSALTAAERAAAMTVAKVEQSATPAPMPPAPAPTRKEGKHNEPVKGLSEEQLRVLRERAQEGERRRGRVVGAILFLLFAFLLLFAIPLLYDPTRTKAQVLLGEQTKIVMGALAVLSVVSLVRTWAVQIQSKPVMLRPVTTMLKVVTAVVCALAATFFLPPGALGPAERAARFALPWASGGFYLSLGLYGLITAVRAVNANLLHAGLLVLLSSGSLLGSYRALSSTVMEDARRRRMQAQKDQSGAVIEKLGDFATGQAPRSGSSSRLSQRKEVGASEAEDLKAIEVMQDQRKQQSTDLDKLHKAMEKIAK